MINIERTNDIDLGYVKGVDGVTAVICTEYY